MIENLAKRLKAWGKEIKRGHDAALFEALPQMLKDKIEQEIEEMTKEPQVFIVGREHSRKDGEFVYLAEFPELDNGVLHTTGIKVNALEFTNPTHAQKAADRANRYLGIDVFKVGLPEQFRSNMTASQAEAHRLEAEKAARRNGMTTEEWQARRDELVEGYAKRKAQAEALSGAKLVNGKELNRALNNNGESLKVNAIVERPAHYNQGSIDVIEALYQLLTWEQFKGFMQGNIIKYSVRFEDKDDPILDLEKAEYYTKRLKEYRMKHHEAELREKEGRA